MSTTISLILFLAVSLMVFTASSTNQILIVKKDNRMNEEAGLESLIDRDRTRLAIMSIPSFLVNGTFNKLPQVAGLYYTTIKLGTPPKELHVSIDTGSNTFWVNCNPCQSCPLKSNLGFTPNLYDLSTSITGSSVSCSDKTLCISAAKCANDSRHSPCIFGTVYEDQSSTSGYFVTDLLHMNTIDPDSLAVQKSSSTRILFACSTSPAGILTNEKRAVDGILGLGHSYPSTISQLTSKRIIPKVFSHCLGRDDHGVLVLGEMKEAAEGIVYSPLRTSQGSYNLYLKNIAVNGHPLPINPNVYDKSSGVETIIDTGTTLAYLQSEAYVALINMINAVVAQSARPVTYTFGGSQCYKSYNSNINIFSSIDAFPDVSFNFAGNASMILTPLDYLFKLQPPIVDDVPTICIGFRETVDANLMVLGDIALKDKIIVYDLDKRRVGWKQYNCSLGVHVFASSSPHTLPSIIHIIIMMIYILSSHQPVLNAVNTEDN